MIDDDGEAFDAAMDELAAASAGVDLGIAVITDRAIFGRND